MTQKQKLYPFSFQKHAHDIELRINRLWLEMYDMELGDTPFNQEQYDRMDALHLSLQNLLLAMMDNTRDGRVTYLTGPQIGLAKETVIWASEVRANRMKGVTK